MVFVDTEETDEEEKGEDLERILTPVEPKPLEEDGRVVIPLEDVLEPDMGLDGATSVEWVAYDDVDEEQVDESGSEVSDREVDDEEY